ncbi:MAG: hypothetical protein U9Q03_04695 [Patescibacteria group bacterium]|nr:hypothetical protein [Patescibacteria group bacterium]
MKAQVLSVITTVIIAACVFAGCESCGARVDNTVTFAVMQNQRVREIICHGHDGRPVTVAKIDVFRSEHTVEVDVTPLGGHLIDCAAVCVSTVSADAEDCGTWGQARRNRNGSFSLDVSETAYDPQLCTQLYYVHVRLRVTHHGSCDL